MNVNDKGQIVGESALRWFKYRDDDEWWTLGDSSTPYGSGFRIKRIEGRHWQLRRIGNYTLRFEGTVRDCMQVAEIYIAQQGGRHA